MDRSLEKLIWSRAKGNCEYCQMRHECDELPFEHTVFGQTAAELL